ncbi:hypothetical protein KGQ34_01305 [Patescibacteria group bacterium]|nr:hypothetical protein [Patescibacteria group bacterium]
MKKITLEEWRHTHIDDKKYVNGVPHLIVHEDGVTISVPVDIDRSVPPQIGTDKYIGCWTAGMMAETSEMREAVEKAFRAAVLEHEDWLYAVEVSNRKFYVASNGEMGFTAMLVSEY